MMLYNFPFTTAFYNLYFLEESTIYLYFCHQAIFEFLKANLSINITPKRPKTFLNLQVSKVL